MLGVAPQLVLLLHNRDLYKTRHSTAANYVTQIRKPTKLSSVLGFLLPNHHQPSVNVPVYPFANNVSKFLILSFHKAQYQNNTTGQQIFLVLADMHQQNQKICLANYSSNLLHCVILVL